MVLSEEGIYVSRFNGHDTKTCGKESSPCRTISYGIQQLSTWLYIYVDGTDTLKNPYACEALDPGHPGILLTKSASFVSIKSRAHISCLHGNPWLADGTQRKHGIRISFTGLAFLNTSVRLFDAAVAVDDTVFAKTKSVSLAIQVRNLPRFDLSLDNVVFEKNAACITLKPNQNKNFVNITNTIFYQNGDPSSYIPSILGLISSNTSINIRLKNCSFVKNIFREYGMFTVINVLGGTNVLLKQLMLKENRQIYTSIKNYNGLFCFKSKQLFLILDHGHIYKTTGTLLYVNNVQLAVMNISNIEMDEFYSRSPGGGIVNVIRLDSCHQSIKDSSFRNGNNYDNGGILFIAAKNTTLIIQNSTIHNISSSNSGGAVYIQSDPKDYPQPTNPNRNFVVFLRIINSSFSNCSSRMKGGALYVWAQTLSAIIEDSLFLKCNTADAGGALLLKLNDSATIRLHNSYFLKNSAYNGGIVHIQSIEYRKDSSINVSITNVTFLENRIFLQPKAKYVNGVAHFSLVSAKVTVDFKNTYFIKNFARNIIVIVHDPSNLSFVTLDNCIFRNNVGNYGTVGLSSRQIFLTCKNSIFDSNGRARCFENVGVFRIFSKGDSMIFITNTTFVNNFCQTISTTLGGISTLTITDSTFIRNRNTDGFGGILGLASDKNHPDNYFRVHITRALFQENIGHVGSVLSLIDVTAVVFTNCTFLNNFALSQGGLIFNGISSSFYIAIFNSVFRQTIPKIIFNSTKKFMATSFLRLLSTTVLYIVNTTFDQRAKSYDPLILVSAAKNANIDNTSLSFCPFGHRIEKNYYSYVKRLDHTSAIGCTFSCKECDYNFYSLQRGTARGLYVDDSFQCLPCPRGAECIPAIKSKTNFWGYHVSLNPPKLAFTNCPFGYCKSPSINSTEYNACQGKRTGVMCGMCSQGYTEALWSTYCTPIKDCNDYWFWILFVTLVFSMAVILFFKPPFVTYCLKQIFWFRTNSRIGDTHNNHDIIPPSFLNEESPQENNISSSTTQQHKQDKRQFSRFVDIIFYFYQIA